MNVENLTRFQARELLRWFLQDMMMDKRTELINTYPKTYNAMLTEPLFEVSRIEES